MRRSGLLAMVASLVLVAGCATAILLPDGRVLLRNIVAKAYDPATGRVSNLSMPTTLRVYETSTLLDSGMVLIAGGAGGDASSFSASQQGQTLASAELYDPATDTYAATGSMAKPRGFHTATRLADGRVLIVGGGMTNPTQGGVPDIDTALPPPEIYDPATGTFGPAGGTTSIPRLLHSATLLGDGKVLIAGGITMPMPVDGASPDPNASGAPTAVAELFDPATGTFSATGSMTMPRLMHTATALPDGRVLFVGGTVDTDMTGEGAPDPTMQTAEIYDPATGTFTATAAPSAPRVGHAAVLMADGRVLVTGGTDSDPATPESFAKSAEIFDPGAGSFAPTGDMSTGRAFHAATTLADGRVLVAGFGEETLGTIMSGRTSMPDLLSSAELFDPGTGTFSAVEVEPAVVPVASPAG